MTGKSDEQEQLQKLINFLAYQEWHYNGENFFQSLVALLAELSQVDFAFVGRLTDELRVETLALFANGNIAENIQYDLRGTPCENVIGKENCFYPKGIQELFPEDNLLVEMGAVGYAGIPLWDHDANPLGIIVVMSTHPIENRNFIETLIEMSAIRVSSELLRLTWEQELANGEERFRDFAVSAADRFWETDEEFRITFVSELKELGSRPQIKELKGKTSWEIAGADVNDEKWRQHIADLKAHRLIRDFEFPQMLKDGKVIWLRVSAKPIFDDNGNFRGYRGSNTDITERKIAEERFSKAFYDSPMMQSITQLDTGVMVDVNKAWVETLGYEREEAIGKSAISLKIMADFTADTRSKLIDEIRAKKDFVNIETTARTKSGDLKEFNINADLIVLDGTEHLLLASEDITERKKTEKLFSAVFRDGPAIYTMTTPELHGSKIIDVSENWLTIMGYTREEAIGKTPEELNIWWAPDGRKSLFANLDEDDRVKNFETTFRTKNGKKLEVSISAQFIGTGSDKFFLLVFQDITELKSAENELQDAHDELEKRVHERTAQLRDEVEERKRIEQHLVEASQQAESANRAKSEFLANMSHELRTPLNAIIGFSDVLREKTFGPFKNEKQEEYIKNIHDSGQHLLNLIEDILDVSVIEADKLEMNETDVKIEDVIEASLLMVKSRADQGGIELTNLVNNSALVIRGDERRLKQILVNLLSNAVKFTKVGGQVNIGAKANKDNSATIFVTDTGIGMNEADRITAMENFGQTERGDLMQSGEGTGLGLPLTKKLVEAHGGTLEIDSEPNKGTTVIVHIPPERVV